MPEPTDLAAIVRALLRSQRELADALERAIGPPDLSQAFVPTDLQAAILAALKNKALRTDAIICKVDCSRSQLFRDPGGLPELQDEGLVSHHKRIGFYRSDAPPPDLPANLQ